MIEGKTSISELLPWGFPYWTVSIGYQSCCGENLSKIRTKAANLVAVGDEIAAELGGFQSLISVYR